MSNTLLTIEMVTRESLMVLENTLKATQAINREYDDKFAVSGAKIGNTLNIRKPPRYLGRDGDNLQVENSEEDSVPLILNHKFGCDVEFGTSEMTLDVDDYSSRFLRPQVATVSNMIDRLVLSNYIEVANFVGTPGTTPTALLTYLEAKEKLREEAVPDDGLWSNVITPKQETKIVDALKGLPEKSSTIANQYMTGQMSTAIGLNWFVDQNVFTHRVGPLGGTPLVNTADQTGTSLITDGWTAAAANRLKRGDVITITDVYAVNPQHRESTGSLRNFVVTQDADSDGSGNLTVNIYPSMIAAGAKKTIDALAANNAPIQIFGHASTYASARTPAGLVFHRDFATLGVADLMIPKNKEASRVSSKKLGLSLRMIRDYNINNDKMPSRIDVLCGTKVLYPEFACRVQG